MQLKTKNNYKLKEICNFKYHNQGKPKLRYKFNRIK